MTDVLAVAAWPTNAHLIADVAAVGYLDADWPVLDPTFGLGTWWNIFKPRQLTACDIDPAKSPLGRSIDFTDLPFGDGAFRAVAFDPPYKLCLDAATEVLTRRGWMGHDDVEVGDYAYSIDPRTLLGSWQPITAVNVHPGRHEVVACAGKNLDFVATPDHRWLILDAGGTIRWRTTSTLRHGDRVPHSAARAAAPNEPTYDDAFVELVAWFWTEGTWNLPSLYGHITQSHAVNAAHCDRIAGCLERLYGPAVDALQRTGRTSVPAWRTRDEERNRRFIFSASIGAELAAVAPGKIVSLEFLEALTPAQLELFIEVSLLADGQSEERLAQADSKRAESFALACILSGRAVTMLNHHDGNGDVVSIKRRAVSKPLRAGLTLATADLVWCPTVANTGTWLARRNGRIYFTGNSGRPDLGEFDQRYGVDKYQSREGRHRLILAGVNECARVLAPGGYLLVKVQDQVNGGRVRWQTDLVSRYADTIGLEKVDAFHMLSYRPQPSGTRQQHARRNHSTLLVFARSGPAASAAT